MIRPPQAPKGPPSPVRTVVHSQTSPRCMHTSYRCSAFGSLTLAIATLLAPEVQAQVFTRAPGVMIPDYDASGVSDTLTVSLPYTGLGSIQVGLRIASAPGEEAWNGDLYAYLYHDGALAVLLNRPGRTASNPDGGSHPGMEITFSTGNTLGDIHDYGDHPLWGAGSTTEILTGIWSPDGRSTSPNLVTDESPRDSDLSVFDHTDPNGLWLLFVADRAGGSVAKLERWSLEFSPFAAIPEVRGTCWMLALAALACVKVKPPTTPKK